MLDSEETAVKMHYICQTYVMKQKGQQMALHVDKVFECKLIRSPCLKRQAVGMDFS